MMDIKPVFTEDSTIDYWASIAKLRKQMPDIEYRVKQWAKCIHAEVHSCGDVYIEDPMNGHYLDDSNMMWLWQWLTK